MNARFVYGMVLAAVVGGCGGSSAEAPAPGPNEPPVVELGGALHAPRTLYRGHVYVVRDLLDVEAPLTIQPGAIVKFGPNGALWGHTGRIVAVGTAAEPIVFTSLADDAHGGDTNADGAATAPAAGSSSYSIESRVEGSTFDHCQILYGGKPASRGALVLAGPTTVRDSVIAHCDGSPGAVVVEAVGAGSVVASNVFFGNRVPLALSGAARVEGNSFHEPSAVPPYDARTGNWPNEVHLVPTEPWMAPTTAVYTGATSLSIADVPVVAQGNLAVPAGSGFTLDDTVLKLKPGQRITVDDASALRLLGGALLTSWLDGAHGGPGMPPLTPAAGDWLGVWSARAGAWVVDARFLYSASSSP